MNREPAGIPLTLPTVLTLGNLGCGFIAVSAAGGGGLFTGGVQETGAWVLLAMVFDGMDGRAARWLGLCGRFGTQLDNLADMVSFGVAPGLLLSQRLALPAGLAAAVGVLYAGCVALRLARFASERPAESPPVVFTGLPSPAAAAVVVSATCLGAGDWLLCGLAAVVGALMVSRRPFPHPANRGRRQR